LTATAGRLGDLLERERLFADDASHQLRTPISQILLLAEAALGGPDSGLRPRIVALEASARALSQTLVDMVWLRHPPGVGTSPAEARLLTVLDDLVSRWKIRFEAAGRSLTVESGMSAAVLLPSTSMARQVLDILVDNALRHGSGEVRVTARAVTGGVAVDVADEGSCVDLDLAMLFRRGPASADGHGIGLALADRLARAEGCRVVLSSAESTVFTFVVSLPNDEADGSPRSR
jgi:signal transduction histidine kinase